MAAVLNVIGLLAGGIALLPLLESLVVPPADQVTTVRIVLGVGVNVSTAGLGGNEPGVALWDRFGRSIGTNFGSSKILPEGSSRDIEIVANPEVGNVPAEYISITHGGDDAICVAGISVTFADGSKSAWTGDVAAGCPNTGAFIFQSSRPMAATTEQGPQTPHCVWIDRNGSNGIPHQGIGIHLPDFGNQITKAQAEVYRDNKDLMCQSGPRFRMYQQLRAENPILTFNPPLTQDEDGLDPDPGFIINNPGVFAEQDEKALQHACGTNNKVSGCDQLPTPTFIRTGVFKRVDQTGGPQHRTHPRHYPLPQDYIHSESAYMTGLVGVAASIVRTRTPSVLLNSSPTVFAPVPTNPIMNNDPSDSKISNDSGGRLFHGQLIVSSQEYHSAKRMCEHPNSFGPSIASTHEGLFCDMIEKKLYPICEQKNNANDSTTGGAADGSYCFNIDQKELEGYSDNAAASSMGVSVTRRADQPFGNAPTRTGTYTEIGYW